MDLIPKIKDRAEQLGYQLKIEFLDYLNKSIHVLPSIVGNEVIIATVVPMIPSLLYDAVKKKIFEVHVPDIGERLQEHRDELNFDFINRLDGRKLFQDTISEILEQTNEEKIEYLKKFLINSYVNSDVENETKQHYMLTLQFLRPIELQLLRILFQPEEVVNAIVAFKQASNNSGSIDYALKIDIQNYLELDKILFEKIVSNLVKSDCISESGKSVLWSEGSYNRGMPGELISRANEDAKRMLTEYGNNFVKFVTKEL